MTATELLESLTEMELRIVGLRGGYVNAIMNGEALPALNNAAAHCLASIGRIAEESARQLDEALSR